MFARAFEDRPLSDAAAQRRRRDEWVATATPRQRAERIASERITALLGGRRLSLLVQAMSEADARGERLTVTLGVNAPEYLVDRVCAAPELAPLPAVIEAALREAFPGVAIAVDMEDRSLDDGAGGHPSLARALTYAGARAMLAALGLAEFEPSAAERAATDGVPAWVAEESQRQNAVQRRLAFEWA